MSRKQRRAENPYSDIIGKLDKLKSVMRNFNKYKTGREFMADLEKAQIAVNGADIPRINPAVYWPENPS